MTAKSYIKTDRALTTWRKYAWIFTLLIAIGGLWEPRLGLIVIGVMAALTITALFKGRYWCGNICPHGSLYDVLLLPISLNRKTPGFLKTKLFILAFFAFFMFNFGRRVTASFQAWGEYDFAARLGFVFVLTYLIVMIVGGLLAVFINPRVWCQFCPMGTIQKAAYLIGKSTGLSRSSDEFITISDPEKCIGCGKCERVCPFQLAPYKNFDRNRQFRDVVCIKCGVCAKNCPLNLLSLEKEKADTK